MINTHLWVSGEPMLEPNPEEETSLDNFPWFKKNILKKKVVHIPKIEEIPEEASSEKEVYLSQGIKSLSCGLHRFRIERKREEMG